MEYAKIFLCFMGLYYLRELGEKHLGKSTMKIILILLLGVCVALELFMEHFIVAGLGFIFVCLYIFSSSEEDPDDQDKDDEELIKELMGDEEK